MELFTLDAAFQPNRLVENYDSLIWTERYSTNGDFEIKSNDVAGLLNALPDKSFVSLRETSVPMVVESHKIHKPKNKAPEVVIKGRSFETVLERRASVNSLPSASAREPWTIAAAKESDAAYQAMRIVLGDIPRYQEAVQVLSALAPAVSPLDAIPEIDLILPDDYSTLTTETYEIKPTQLYAAVLEMININHHGLKAVRPDTSNSKVGIEIYNGANLTETLSFDARFDQLDESTYLLSDQGSVNVGYVYGSNGSQVVLKTSAPEPSGLDRRVLLVDESNDNTINTSEIRHSRGLVELYKYNSTALFDGEVAEQVAAGYNRDYFLGDILQLIGEYGLYQNVRVTEFIRTSDATGEKRYPTLEAVGE